MDDNAPLIMSRETLEIEGGRNLYVYTFREENPQDRLIEMIQGGEIGVIQPYLARHPGVDLAGALALARSLGNGEAATVLSARIELRAER